MANTLIRIGIYWFPPMDLLLVLRDSWRGKLNNYPACKLISAHCGECPVWDVHATLLDAVSILAKDRPAFVRRMQDILKKHLPIDLGKPELWFKWPPNVFIRWLNEKGMEKIHDLRKALMDAALDFIVLQPVSWEAISDLEYTISISSKPVRQEFVEGLNALKELMKNSPPNLIVAPNIPLPWYIDSRLSKGLSIEDGKLPFGSSAHISVCTAVRDDEIEIDGKLKSFSANEVQKFIQENLENVPEWKSVLDKQHTVNTAHIVEPASPFEREPIEVVVSDRIFGGTRKDLRQPWIKKERLIMRFSSGIQETLNDLSK